MTWDFAEGNPFSRSSGNFQDSVGFVASVVERLTLSSEGYACQSNTKDAVKDLPRGGCGSPYYDNIGYADLSDFFYVWLRRSIGRFYPDHTATVLTPKADELVATPYRFGGSKAKAEEHFERGFVRTFTHIRENHAPDIPLTIFYAFKQAESDTDGTASTGWETMLNGLHGGGAHTGDRDVADADRAEQPDGRTGYQRTRLVGRSRVPPAARARRGDHPARLPRRPQGPAARGLARSSNRAGSLPSTLRRRRSGPGWRSSRHTARSWRPTGRR